MRVWGVLIQGWNLGMEGLDVNVPGANPSCPHVAFWPTQREGAGAILQGAPLKLSQVQDLEVKCR